MTIEDMVLRRERDAFRERLRQEGVCLTCVAGAPEPYGCSDCLNTGYAEGSPVRPATVGELRAAYLAGFMAAGEGYNGEYPPGKDWESDASWSAWRDQSLAEIFDKRGSDTDG